MVHVKYPSMERQDLTQSQLGSFKFTPVDEAPPSPSPHPLLLQQYSQSLQAAGYLDHRAASRNVNDPTFFNRQIRPSLDASRLRLGPASMRAAVQSASTSPQKRFGYRHNGAMRPNAQNFQPHFQGSENDSMRSFYMSEDRSVPLSMNNSESYTALSFEHPQPHPTVLKALESEQVAHEATKIELEREAHARQEAEAETARLAECNKGLVNSINLLKSTVRHLVQKENDSIPNPASLDHAVEEFNKAAQNNNPSGSILYDVLTNYKATHVAMRDGEEKVATFNLDLLNTPDRNDKSEKAQLQRTLRRQMGISSELDAVGNLNTEYQPNIGSAADDSGQLLLDIPLHLGSPPRTPVRNFGQDPAEVPEEPDIQRSEPTVDSGIMLELPTSFLNKYNKKRANVATEDLLPIDTPHKTILTCASAIKPGEYDMDGRSLRTSSKLIWMPDTPLINWKIDNRHRSELRGNSALVQTRTQNSHFLNYPLRYIPNVLDDNLYRTVMIDFIPFGTPYNDVLNQIRGGTLELIQMYGPIGGATDFVTARVIYTDENGATALYRRGQDPGIKINGTLVRVWQVLEATYPKNKELEEAVYVHGHTRILVIHAPVLDINNVLKRKLRNQIEAGLVLDIGRSHDGVPIVEFTSIEESTKALRYFLDDKDFAGADFDFEEDYCNSRFPDEADDE